MAGPRTLTSVAQIALVLMAMTTVELLAQSITTHRAGDALAPVSDFASLVPGNAKTTTIAAVANVA